MPPATAALRSLAIAVPADAVAVGPVFANRLDRFGEQPALVTDEGTWSYVDLEQAVASMLARLGSVRRLVALPAHPSPETIVALLAALRGGHPLLLLPPCTAESIAAAYRPGVVFTDGQPVSTSATHDLHPDLALCLSTSGATGSSKLVRLSARNLGSNAEAVAQSLALTSADRGITALSIGYSYGLSVLTSHLAVGASLVVTDASVTEERFWGAVERHRVTTLPAVPYSLDLMERAGLLERRLPALRLVTCAGGALPPERALVLHRAGRLRGWGLSLMYGQTEATARIACLPPELLAEHPDAVGPAIPSGRLSIADPDDRGVGEIVYEGPNVMMGYALSAADLALGSGASILRTGDLGRLDGGLLHVVGRRSRIAKVRGLRISLDDVDGALRAAGIEGCSVAVSEGIAVATATPDHEACRRVAAEACSLPVGLVTVVGVDALPRTESGKVRCSDVAALIRDRQASAPVDGGHAVPPSDPLSRLQDAYSTMLGTAAGLGDSFASLGGDSLSYVEVSLAVEGILGHLPTDWHKQPLRELALSTEHVPEASPSSPRRWRTVEGTVALRAAAIVLVVGSHAQAFDIRGGAHILMALVGFNIARFQLGTADRRQRTKRMWRSTARILAPALAFLLALVLLGGYDWSVLGFNSIANPTEMGPEWRYWFIEALLWILPAAVVLLSLPAVHRLLQRHPFGFPLSLTGALFLAGRFLVPQEFPVSVFSPLAIAWLAALGWTIAEARTIRQRLVLSVLVVAVVPWTLYGLRMLIVPAGLMLLLWMTRVRLPGPLAVAAALVAEASLVIYLLHWPVLDLVGGWAALALSLLIGAAGAWLLVRGVRCWRGSAKTVVPHTNR